MAARRFLLEVLSLGLPTATELLDPITPQYISDLISWSAIGARTTESQTHRQMASGLSMPLGFKNATSGDVAVAINAILAAAKPQTFLGISHQGLASALTTRGNRHCHLILRGGKDLTNFDLPSVSAAAQALQEKQLPPAIMVDCSHDNSSKDPSRQPAVLATVVQQAASPSSPIMGIMLESNIRAGSQPFPQPVADLLYGQSITDGCIDWATTEKVLRETAATIRPRLSNQSV
jgi:3-deoxy-7-phosphoheptulonate synthase